MNLISTARRAAAAAALGGLALTPAAATATVANAAAPTSVMTVSAVSLQAVERPFLEPVPAELPVSDYRLTGRYGEDGGLWSEDHTGLDFAAPYGSTIRAIRAGRVIASEYDGAYGLKTVIRLDDGTTLWFCHQSASTVRPGERVAAGRIIGAVGTSGNVTGPHLHLEVHRGKRTFDPAEELRAWGLHP